MCLFRPLLTPLSTAPSPPPSQFTVCTSRFARLRYEIIIEISFVNFGMLWSSCRTCMWQQNAHTENTEEIRSASCDFRTTTDFLGNGRNTVSRVLFRRRELTEPHWVLQQTRRVLRKTRWVRFGTQIIGWEELTEIRAELKVTELRWRSPICDFLRFSAKICGFLQKSEVFCGFLCPPNAWEFPVEWVNLRKSAVFCENLRFGLSLAP